MRRSEHPFYLRWPRYFLAIFVPLEKHGWVQDLLPDRFVAFPAGRAAWAVREGRPRGVAVPSRLVRLQPGVKVFHSCGAAGEARFTFSGPVRAGKGRRGG